MKVATKTNGLALAAAATALFLEQSSQKVVPPPSVADQQLPVQALGIKPSRALPYELHVSANAGGGDGKVWLVFSNTGGVGAVFHVYDKLHLDHKQLDAEHKKLVAELDQQMRSLENFGHR